MYPFLVSAIALFSTKLTQDSKSDFGTVMIKTAMDECIQHDSSRYRKFGFYPLQKEVEDASQRIVCKYASISNLPFYPTTASAVVNTFDVNLLCASPTVTGRVIVRIFRNAFIGTDDTQTNPICRITDDINSPSGHRVVGKFG